jgi:hypothetical protein
MDVCGLGGVSWQAGCFLLRPHQGRQGAPGLGGVRDVGLAGRLEFELRGTVKVHESFGERPGLCEVCLSCRVGVRSCRCHKPGRFGGVGYRQVQVQVEQLAGANRSVPRKCGVVVVRCSVVTG